MASKPKKPKVRVAWLVVDSCGDARESWMVKSNAESRARKMSNVVMGKCTAVRVTYEVRE